MFQKLYSLTNVLLSNIVAQIPSFLMAVYIPYKTFPTPRHQFLKVLLQNHGTAIFQPYRELFTPRYQRERCSAYKNLIIRPHSEIELPSVKGTGINEIETPIF